MRRSADQLDDDRMLQDSVRGLLTEAYAWTPNTQRDTGLRADIAAMGWPGMSLPASLGGSADAVQALLVIEEAGRVLLPRPLGADLLVAPHLIGRSPSLGILAPGLLTGTVRFALVTEDERREPILFEPTGRGARLSGSTGLVLESDATHCLIGVGSHSANGAAVLCIEAGRTEREDCPLLDGRPAHRLTFRGVELDGVIVLATGHAALEVMQEMRDLSIAASLADAHGALSAGMDLAVGYLNQRKQFGVTLGSLQAVQHLMADAFCDLQGVRSMLAWISAAIGAAPAERHRAAMSAKIVLGRNGVAAASCLIQACGGIAMTEDYAIGHVYKRLLIAAGLDGSTERSIDELAAATTPRNREDQA